MSVIRCELQDQYLLITDNPVISAGDVSTDKIEFALDSSWNISDVSLFAVFYKGEETPLETNLELQDDKYYCPVPDDYTETAGKFNFGIIARDSENKIVKTSTVRAYFVVNGTPNTNETYVDWMGFFNDVKEILEEKLSINIPDSATTAEVLEIAREATSIEETRSFFIDLMNYYFHSDLPYDATNEQIAFAFDHGVEQAVRQVQIELNSLIGEVKSISDDFVTGPHTGAEPAWLDYCMDVRDYCQKAFDALLDLYA